MEYVLFFICSRNVDINTNYRYSKKANELKRIMESNCEDSNAHIEYIRLRRRVNILSAIDLLLMLVFAILYQF